MSQLNFAIQILLPTLNILKDEYNDADDNSNMITPAQIALQLVDWTDPTKAVYVSIHSVKSMLTPVIVASAITTKWTP